MVRRYWHYAILATLLLLAGHYPLRQTWLSSLGFFPLFALCFNRLQVRPGVLILAAFAVSAVYWAVILNWLPHYSIESYFAVWALHVVIFPVYFLLLRLLASRQASPFARALAAAALWIALENLYALSPLTSAAFTVPFLNDLALAQAASVTGFSAATGFVMGLNASVGQLTFNRSRDTWLTAIFFALAIAAILYWGRSRLETEVPAQNPLNVTLIQHNLPVDGRWRLDHADEIKAAYRKLAEQAAQGDADLIIFPLYSLEEDILREPELFPELARETGKYILAASHIPEAEGQTIFQAGYFNAALLYDPEGKIAGTYRAVQGPPFTEDYEFTEERYAVLETPFGKLGVLLCYEDVHPWMVHEAVRSGAEILIALSNPGHFKTTYLPDYYLLQDQLRAIESGRFLARVSANGYSAIVNPYGKAVQRTKLDSEEILRGRLHRLNAVTPFHRTFRFSGIAAVALLVFISLKNVLGRKRQT